VTGENKVGGIAGWNRYSNITCSYACALVAGTSQVGGAVGLNGGKVSYCYAAGPVDGKTQVGGLIGARYPNSEAYLSYWDLQTTGQSISAGGAGKTTEEMMALSTFRGWGTSEAWRMDDGRDYPRLIWEMMPGVPMADVHWLYEGGTGEPNDPFQISTADHLTAIAYHPEDLDKHFVLTADIDLSKIDANGIIPIGDTITPFTGVFDGRGHVIHGLRRVWEGGIRTGLFGVIQTPGWLLRDDPLESLLTACAASPSASNLGILRGCVMNLHLRDVDVKGGDTVGALAGRCWGIILCCSVDGQVGGTGRVGGLVGYSEGYVIACQSTGYVTAEAIAGGLLGGTAGPVLCCHSSASVQAGKTAGGLVGNNAGHVAWCLSTGPVSATEEPGGLCGAAANGSVYLSYWDVETSGCRLSQGGRGRTPEQLRDLRTYRGWGYSGLWRTPDGMDRPQLVWENVTGQVITDDPRPYGAGTGSADDPYQIWSVEDFIALGYYPEDFDKHFILVSDLDLSDADPNALLPIGTPILPFTGVFDGDNSGIHGLTYPHPGESCIGVFGSVLASDAGGPVGGTVRNLLVQDIDIAGGDRVGGLVGVNRGSLTDCHVTGRINGRECVGGLVGANQEDGSIVQCTSNIVLEADTDVGGLVGYNDGSIEASCARGFVTGRHNVGGLLGNNGGTVAQTFADAKVKGGGRIGGLAGQSYGGSILWSYSQGTVDGGLEGPTIGGLIGYNYDVVSHCYSACRIRGDTYASSGGLIGMDWWGEIKSSFWDTDISGARRGVGRPDPYPGGVTGLPTPRMQTAATFIGAGWDFIDETENGTEDIWLICEGQDYPRLWWEEVECEP
jgi:hypothetical protein